MAIGGKRVAPREKNHLILLWSVRILLLFLLTLELFSNRTAFQIFYFIVFLLSFAPSFFRRILSISLPFQLELLYLISLLLTVLGEKIFSGILVQFVLGIFFGIFGFLLMYTFYYNSRMKISALLITLFSFSFAVSAGTLWLVFLFLLSQIDLWPNITNGVYIPLGLLLTILGAGIVAIIEYLYLAYGEANTFQRLIKAFMRKNPDLFIETDSSPEAVLNLIEQGENEQLEFKSSLRTNVHTKKPDKKIEHAVLKTITAFLNSDGGTLLVGVADDGKIIGIDHDGFSNNDKFYQHYTNLVQNHIGNEYLPLIKSKLIQMNDVTILKIDCRQSNKAVFFSIGDEQYFYVRIGPASVKLTGKKLLEYVNKKF